MQTAILFVGSVAALGAVAAVLVPLWQQRLRLGLTFTSGYSSAGDQVSLAARVENNGRSMIHNVELFGGPPGLTLDSPYRITSVSLPPFTSHNFTVSVPRPQGDDLDPNVVTLKAPLLIVARYGRRMTIIEMPAGPYSTERQRTGSRRARGQVATWQSEDRLAGLRRRFHL